MEKYDQSKWIYIPKEDTEFRYVLGTVGENPLFVVGINPSTAVPGKLDPTMKSVERIANGNGFDSYIMLNVYPQRATNPNEMDLKMNGTLHENNLRVIEKVFQNSKGVPIIWAAWGTNLVKRKYLKECLIDLVKLSNRYQAKWCKVGKVSKDGHPHHPLYLKKDSKIEEFNIWEYINEGMRIDNGKKINKGK